ncbi:MAG TPA: hypothetical protein VJP40_09305 [bacterium]|nr:hypothetical protein [bacterium]
MKAAKPFTRVWHSLALVLLMIASVACGSGNGDENGGTPTPTPTPLAVVGDYFITDFKFTNTADASEILDFSNRGVSTYFTLNGDGSANGAVQIPTDPPEVTVLTGTWEQDDSTLVLTFTDQQGDTRTITGSLSQDSEGDVIFSGSQTAGPPVEFDDDGNLFTISTFVMQRYSADITSAELAGQWNAVQGTAFKNTDASVSEDTLTDGASLTLIFDGENVEIRNTFSGGGEDNFIAAFTIPDNFHLALEVEEEIQTLVISLVDGTLTIYLYDTSRVFEGDSVDSPATLVFVLERP